MTVQDLRAVLRALDAPALAALLHELGFELYRREVQRWRVLSELAAELLSEATIAARARMADLVTGSRAKLTRPRRQRSRRRLRV